MKDPFVNILLVCTGRCLSVNPQLDLLNRAVLIFIMPIHRDMHWELVFRAVLISHDTAPRGSILVILVTSWKPRMVLLLSPVRLLLVLSMSDDAVAEREFLLLVHMATLPRPFTPPSTRLPRLPTFRLTETTSMTE